MGLFLLLSGPPASFSSLGIPPAKRRWWGGGLRRANPPIAQIVATNPDSCPPFSRDKSLSELSTWGIGGPAKLFCEVHHHLHLAAALRHCSKHNIRFFVLGKGSNCLFDHRGFDGCIILNCIDFLEEVSPGVYHVGSGYPFSHLGVKSANKGQTGLEFAGGIPGTVGGAVFMNAGANGQETADVVMSVELITSGGEKLLLKREDLAFGYRSSPFQKLKDTAVISAVTFNLAPSMTAKERQRTYLERRRSTQPVSQRTAGCVFRNPLLGNNVSAGALIEQVGLKGFSIGGAKVSDLHANFILNAGTSTTSDDVLSLISFIKERILSKFGVELQEEIIYVPYNEDTGS